MLLQLPNVISAVQMVLATIRNHVIKGRMRIEAEVPFNPELASSSGSSSAAGGSASSMLPSFFQQRGMTPEMGLLFTTFCLALFFVCFSLSFPLFARLASVDRKGSSIHCCYSLILTVSLCLFVSLRFSFMPAFSACALPVALHFCA